jgi:glucose-1-phosphate adenylyltransferase
MEMIDIVPEFNLYEEYWKIYTKSDKISPQYISGNSVIERSLIGEGSEIYGEVYNSVIGCGVTIGEGTVVRDSIIMNATEIGAGGEINKAIIAENVCIGDNVKLGVGEEAENDIEILKRILYRFKHNYNDEFSDLIRIKIQDEDSTYYID